MCQRTLQVYLAGPITGCAYGGATDWRQWVKEELKDEFVCLSPMRSKTYLAKSKDIAKSYDSYEGADCELPEIGKILSCNKGINRRDSWDCRTADVLLMNFADLPVNKEVDAVINYLRDSSHGEPWDLPATTRRALMREVKKWQKRISIGTILELGMAWMDRKPVVCVMPEGNVHEHPMVDDMIDFRCDSLPQAVEVLRALR